MLTGFIVVIILKYILISHHFIVHLKRILLCQLYLKKKKPTQKAKELKNAVINEKKMLIKEKQKRIF